MNRNKLQQGFTLIELMIVVVIVGILASVAMPAYDNYVRKGKRGEGISAIQTVLEAQERYYADHRTYASNLTDLGLANPYITQQKIYSLTAASCAGGLTQCVEITATAIGGQVKDGNLVANTQGKKVRVQGGAELAW